MERMMFWTGADSWQAESSEVRWSEEELTAAGTQFGVDPLPYRLDYTLKTGGDFVTESLDVAARGEHWSRRLRLTRGSDGKWTAEADHAGEVGLPAPGGDLAAVTGALDCDLGRSPLTNFMPLRRHRLHENPGAVDFLMAWVSVPDLGVHPSQQRYEHVRAAGDEVAVVRYVGVGTGFESELEVDREGFVLNYPGIGRRVDSES